MMEGRIFRAVGEVLAQRLESRGITQVAGYGYGAFPIVCSALSSASDIKGGFIREKRKPHGRRRRVEGPIEPSKPVVLLDDILNSGRSASRAVLMLKDEGFHVEGCLTLFNFLWGGGRRRLERAGIWVESVLDINLKQQTPTLESISNLML
jgi:orotate phosphoribosyltransferase